MAEAHPIRAQLRPGGARGCAARGSLGVVLVSLTAAPRLAARVPVSVMPDAAETSLPRGFGGGRRPHPDHAGQTAPDDRPRAQRCAARASVGSGEDRFVRWCCAAAGERLVERYWLGRFEAGGVSVQVCPLYRVCETGEPALSQEAELICAVEGNAEGCVTSERVSILVIPGCGWCSRWRGSRCRRRGNRDAAAALSEAVCSKAWACTTAS